jgi:oxalate decarboxylase/phosphoglucose isomerase-like protein (cupin superfamily)
VSQEIIKKTWGYEKIIHNGGYCMKLLVYTRPIASSLHFHKLKHECFYVVDGLFQLELVSAGGVRNVRKMTYGATVVLPPATQHRIRCLEPGTIVEASSHDDPEDCVRLEPSDP